MSLLEGAGFESLGVEKHPSKGTESATGDGSGWLEYPDIMEVRAAS